MRLRRSALAWLAAALAVAALAGCAARRPATSGDGAAAGDATQGAACPDLSSRSVEEAICERDRVRSLRARFRADVQTSDATRTAEGVLVFRAPGSLRVKLFTLAGLTVYDATWVGDEQRVRGVVHQPLSGGSRTFDLKAGDVLDSPEGDLALVLWALWRPRCPTPPAASGTEARVDAAAARAQDRRVVVVSGAVREEILVRSGAGADPAGDHVVARYADYDCSAQPPLPRRISLEAPARGWRAEVTILEQARDVPLDDALFEVGERAPEHGGS
ncbi:MAG TPA: hypothetical protein VIS07_14620 [Candidatus Binatia bacterium]